MSDANPSEESTAPQPGTSPGRRLARNLALYTLARLVLVVILTAVIMAGAWVVSVQVPVIVAILFAIVIAMPLSLTLFKGLRGQVNSDIAAVDERRRRDKAQLRARLRGEAEPAGSSDSEPGTSGRGTSGRGTSGKPPKDAAEGEEPGGTGGAA